MLIRLIRIGAWLGLAAILFVTVSPIGYRPHDVVSTDFDRAAAYAVLSALFVFAYPRHRLAVAALVVLVAGGAELFQFISPTRHARLADAAVKAAGGIGGLFAGSLLHAGVMQLLSSAREEPAVRVEERRSVT
ncbi:hypothetical protein NN6n1_03410 [Shinella zoogloeoides]